MENFVFHNPTKIIFGKGTDANVGAEVKSYGGPVLLAHSGGDHLKQSGVYQRVISSLQESNLEFIELVGIKPNPLLDKVTEGISICRENNIKFILALGGGSVVDTAKAIAAGVPYSGDVWNLFTGKASFNEALPVGVILTIPAAGSESSNGAVITNEQSGYKLAIIDEVLRPKFAILNPELTYSLPAYQTFCGIADIMSHVMERYFTKVKHVDLTDRLCEAVLTTVIRNARILLSDPADYHARAEIMWSSTIAHNDLLTSGRAGDWGSHMIGMEISALYNSTHGATLSAVTPSWMRYVYKEELDRFIQFAIRVWNVAYDFDAPERTALLGIKCLEDFFREIGLPVSLGELGLDNKRFDEMACKCTERGPVGNIKAMNQNDILNILNSAL
jgi:alcohol dehydrogenase